MPASLFHSTTGSLDQLKTALSNAGLNADDVRFFGCHQHLARQLVSYAHLLQTRLAPFGTSHSLFVGAEWRSLAISSDVQIRATSSGIEARQHTPCDYTDRPGHATDNCINCWFVEACPVATQWRTVGLSVRLRVTDDTQDGERRVIYACRRIEDTAEPTRERRWSEAWSLKDRFQGPEWVDIVPGVQICLKHTMSGILVRRATGSSECPWTTPFYVHKTYTRWVNVVPGLQTKFWVKLEESEFCVLFRKDVDYGPELAVEPIWAKRREFRGRGQDPALCGLKIVQNWSRYATCGYSQNGMSITMPDGDTLELPQLPGQTCVLIAPGIRLQMSSQGGGGYLQVGTDEPISPEPVWTKPLSLAVDGTWTYLSTDVRVRYSSQLRAEVQIRRADGTWEVLRTMYDESVQEPAPGIRVTFSWAGKWGRVAQMEVQYAPGHEGHSVLVTTGEDWAQVMPGLQLRQLPYDEAPSFRLWLPAYGNTGAPIGSTIHGGWTDPLDLEGAITGDDWVNIGDHFRIRRLPNWHRTYEIM